MRRLGGCRCADRVAQPAAAREAAQPQAAACEARVHRRQCPTALHDCGPGGVSCTGQVGGGIIEQAQQYVTCSYAQSFQKKHMQTHITPARLPAPLLQDGH